MNVKRNGSKVTVFPEGRIDTNRAAQFATEMEKALEGVFNDRFLHDRR